MKRGLLFIFGLMLLLGGCSGEEPKDNEQNINFNQFVDAPEEAIALMVNLPTPEQSSLLNITETLFLQETDEKMIFIPRYEHSAIDIYTVDDINEAGEITASKFYSNLDCSKDFAIELLAIRPEGLPHYKIWIRLPNGIEKEYYISYNGKDGNPNLEYIFK